MNFYLKCKLSFKQYRLTKYLQVFSLGEPKLHTTCLCDNATHRFFLEQSSFSGKLKFPLPIERNLVRTPDTFVGAHMKILNNTMLPKKVLEIKVNCTNRWALNR